MRLVLRARQEGDIIGAIRLCRACIAVESTAMPEIDKAGQETEEDALQETEEDALRILPFG